MADILPPVQNGDFPFETWVSVWPSAEGYDYGGGWDQNAQLYRAPSAGVYIASFSFFSVWSNLTGGATANIIARIAMLEAADTIMLGYSSGFANRDLFEMGLSLTSQVTCLAGAEFRPGALQSHSLGEDAIGIDYRVRFQVTKLFGT